jgi:hypothetical protein
MGCRLLRHLTCALAAMTLACSDTSLPPAPSATPDPGPPRSMTGTWLAEMHLTSCEAFSHRTCTHMMSSGGRRTHVLVLTEGAGGVVSGTWSETTTPSEGTGHTVSGTYRNGVLELQVPLSRQCGSAAEWRSAFESFGQATGEARVRHAADEGCSPAHFGRLLYSLALDGLTRMP